MSIEETLEDQVGFKLEYVHENHLRCVRVGELLKQERFNNHETRKFARWCAKSLAHSRMLKPLFVEMQSVSDPDKRSKLIKLFRKIDRKGLTEKYKKQWDEIYCKRILLFQNFD